MRDIKFRAWDRKYKKMIYFNDHKIGILYQWNRFMVSSGWDDEDNPTFTGLYDSTKWEELSEKEKEFWVRQRYKKNNWKGKEIYEGDILKHNKTIIVVEPIVPINRFYASYDTPYEDDWMSMSDVDWEVIGNRFENPELLEVKDE